MKKLSFGKVLPWALLSLVLLMNVGYIAYRWQSGDGQTVTATGQVEVKNTPDLFSFNVYYEEKSNDQAANVAAINKKSKEVVAGLVAAGAEANKIKTTINSNPTYAYPETDKDKYSSTLNVSIDSTSLEAAQKLQDYFVASGAKGSLSPTPTFKPETRKQIEYDLREAAAADAKKNAEQSAKLMGRKLGKVVTISDVNLGGIPMPMMYATDSAKVTMASGMAPQSLEVSSAPVNPGQETSSVSISITYKLR